MYLDVNCRIPENILKIFAVVNNGSSIIAFIGPNNIKNVKKKKVVNTETFI